VVIDLLLFGVPALLLEAGPRFPRQL